MHVPGPTALLKHLVTRVRTGGIVAFHENDFTFPPGVLPPTELSKQIQAWAVPPPGAPGPEMRMGTKLWQTFVDAGLPGPQLMVEAAAGGGPDWPGYALLAETLRSLLPMLEKQGVDPRTVDVDTLADRIRDDVARVRGVFFLPMMFGAWSRKAG
jgi:hypothetical protein